MCDTLNEIRPHDLLRLRDGARVIPDAGFPPWAHVALGETPWVVVRRAPLRGDRIPVGIRGAARSQRCAASVPVDDVLARIAPEDLAALRGWIDHHRAALIPPIAALPFVAAVFEESSLPWGPIGSVGFELASAWPAARDASDLDTIVRSPVPLSRLVAASILGRLAQCPVHIDVQLETPAGAVALAEFASARDKVVLRTSTGPLLVDDPWTTASAR